MSFSALLIQYRGTKFSYSYQYIVIKKIFRCFILSFIFDIYYSTRLIIVYIVNIGCPYLLGIHFIGKFLVLLEKIFVLRVVGKVVYSFAVYPGP